MARAAWRRAVGRAQLRWRLHDETPLLDLDEVISDRRAPAPLHLKTATYAGILLDPNDFRTKWQNGLRNILDVNDVIHRDFQAHRKIIEARIKGNPATRGRWADVTPICHRIGGARCEQLF